MTRERSITVPFDDDSNRGEGADGAARPFRFHAALVRGAAALASPIEPQDIVERLVDAYSELLGSSCCAVALLDEKQSELSTLASRNTRRLPSPIAIGDIPEALVRLLIAEWIDGQAPVELAGDPWLRDFLGASETDVAWHLILPLVVDGQTRGGVLLGFGTDTVLDDEERAAALALAAIGNAALERHALLERLRQQLRQLDVLHQVSAALTEGADARRLVTRLNHLMAEHDLEVVGMSFRDRSLARHLGGDPATPEERVAWQNGGGVTELPGGVLAVPMRLGRRLVGNIRVRSRALDADAMAFLEVVAGGVADVASRGALRATVEEGRRDRAITQERDRLAADLHDTAGQQFVALGLLAGRLQEQLPAGSQLAGEAARLVELAESGKKQIEQAVRALAFVPAAGRSLAVSLHALARSVAADSGLDVTVETHGRPVRMSTEVEQGLYRVAHEALTNAWRHAHCTTVSVDLVFEPDAVGLTVQDDGVGLRQPDDAGRAHFGIAGMRRAIGAVGGSLQINPGDDGGTVVAARALLAAR